MTAIAATFSDFRPVKSRGVYQIILEVPAENANAVLIALGGVPVFGSEQWVGVAPLKATPEARPEPEAPKEVEPTTPDAPAEKERHPFHDLLRSQQAGILCGNPAFGRWLAKVGMLVTDGDVAKDDPTERAVKAVRKYCGVASRAYIDRDDDAARKWDALRNRFHADTGQTTWERPS